MTSPSDPPRTRPSQRKPAKPLVEKSKKAREAFPPGEYLRWEVDLDDKTFAFEIEEIEIEVELGMKMHESDSADDFGPDGAGFTLRGADGRLYYIPDALDSFRGAGRRRVCSAEDGSGTGPRRSESS